jgi:hypothetical protein
MAIQLVAH